MFSFKKRKMEKDAKKIKEAQELWDKFQNVHNKVYSVKLSLKSLLNVKKEINGGWLARTWRTLERVAPGSGDRLRKLARPCIPAVAACPPAKSTRQHHHHGHRRHCCVANITLRRGGI